LLKPASESPLFAWQFKKSQPAANDQNPPIWRVALGWGSARTNVEFGLEADDISEAASG